MFNKVINRIRMHFGINQLEDWGKVEPQWIRKMDGVGPSTLDHIRMYLAMRNMTLKDDKTPEYWKSSIDTRIVHAMSEDDLRVLVPMKILIDTREQQPFGFHNVSADKSETPADLRRMVDSEEIEQEDIKLQIPREFKSLGQGRGDYSLEGFVGQAHVERKSLHDVHSTVLSYGHRKELFEQELEWLAGLPCSAVVVECSWEQALTSIPQHGKKTRRENRKQFYRTCMAWQVDFRTPWFWCVNRQMAEATTFRILQRYQKHQIKSAKVAAKVDLPVETMAIIESL